MQVVNTRAPRKTKGRITGGITGGITEALREDVPRARRGYCAGRRKVALDGARRRQAALDRARRRARAGNTRKTST